VATMAHLERKAKGKGQSHDDESKGDDCGMRSLKMRAVRTRAPVDHWEQNLACNNLEL
jgi:hypothetical protein